MPGILVELLPFMLGAALAPIWVMIVLLLLRGEGALSRTSAFVAGVLFARVAQGWLGSVLFQGSAAEDGGANIIAATLVTVLGLLLLLKGVQSWRKTPDPDDPPPAWMANLGRMAPLKLFTYGALAMLIAPKMWVFALGALAVIYESGLRGTGAVTAYGIYVLGASLLILLPLLVYAVAPKWAGGVLEGINGWLERNNRVILIVVSFVFGLFFLQKGLGGLLGW